MRRLFLCAVLLPGVVFGARSIQFTPGLVGTADPPRIPAFTAATNVRYEIRLESFTDSGTTTFLVDNYNINIRWVAGGSILFAGNCDGGMQQYAGPFNPAHAYAIRLQRNMTASKTQADWVDLVTGVHQFAIDVATTSPAPCEIGYNYSIGGTSTTMRLAKIEMYSTVVAPTTAPSTTPGDLASWQFENNGNDSSAHALNWSGLNASGNYFDTATLAPVSVISSPLNLSTARAGAYPLTLDGSGAFSPQGTALTYAWTQVSGPNTATLTNTSSVTATATNMIFGTYVFRLTVSDGVFAPVASTVKIGAVMSDDAGVLTQYINPTSGVHDPLIRAITGPLTRYGTSPYVDYENMETVNADQLPWQTSLPTTGYTAYFPGTVHLSNVAGAWHVICDDPSGNPCNFVSNYHAISDGYYNIWIWWDAPGDAPGAHTGRAQMRVSSIASDSDIVLVDTGAYYSSVLTAPSGYHHSQPNDYEIGAWSSGTANWNYYDNVLALLRRYLRTGVDDYLTKFRFVADNFWIIALGSGYEMGAYPRVAAEIGMMARALDGRPERWAGILRYFNYSAWHQGENTTPAAPGHEFGDIREGAYLSRGRAIIAQAAKHADGTADTATRNTYCGWVRQDIQNTWVAGQAADGSWILGGQPMFGTNPTYPADGPGTLPWHMAFPAGALVLARELMLSGACDSALTHATAVQIAADALASLKKAADFQLNYGVDANNGMFYIVNFTAYGNGLNGYTGVGTAAAATSSTNVTGSGTTFLNNFLPDGTTYIGFWGCDVCGPRSHVYRVDHSVSNTSLVLSTAFTDGAVSGSQYSKAESCTNIAGPGLISVANNSTRVTGDVNTRFTQNFYGDNNCDQGNPMYYDCATYLAPFGDRRQWQVKNVIDDHTMDLFFPYSDVTLTNHAYEKGSSCTTHCLPALAATCGGGQDGDPTGTTRGNPQLNIESMAPIAYYYKVSGDSTYKTKALNLFTAASPPGSYPLTTPVYTGQLGKPYGQWCGAGDNQNMLAYFAVSGPCSTLSFSPSSASAVIGGGTGTFTATVTDPTCDRSVTSSAGWLTCTANCTGTGSVTGIGWSAAANAGPARSATLTGGGVQFTVNQSGTVTCTYSLVPTSQNYPAAGATQFVTVTASDSTCAWTATYPDAWLSGVTSGTGTMSISVNAAHNTGAQRFSTATIAGQPYAATQDAAGVTGGPSTMISGGHAMTGGITIQ